MGKPEPAHDRLRTRIGLLWPLGHRKWAAATRLGEPGARPIGIPEIAYTGKTGWLPEKCFTDPRLCATG